MKSPKLVLVQWIDAYHLDGWQFGAIPSAKFDPCWSVGFLMDETKEGIILAQTWFDGDCGNLIGIPKKMINKMTVLGDLKL
jgi:hypothetical protein